MLCWSHARRLWPHTPTQRGSVGKPRLSHHCISIHSSLCVPWVISCSSLGIWGHGTALISFRPKAEGLIQVSWSSMKANKYPRVGAPSEQPTETLILILRCSWTESQPDWAKSLENLTLAQSTKKLRRFYEPWRSITMFPRVAARLCPELLTHIPNNRLQLTSRTGAWKVQEICGHGIILVLQACIQKA